MRTRRNVKFWYVVKIFDPMNLQFTWETAVYLVLQAAETDVLRQELELKYCRMQAHHFCFSDESEKSAA